MIYIIRRSVWLVSNKVEEFASKQRDSLHLNTCTGWRFTKAFSVSHVRTDVKILNLNVDPVSWKRWWTLTFPCGSWSSSKHSDKDEAVFSSATEIRAMSRAVVIQRSDGVRMILLLLLFLLLLLMPLFW